MEKEWDVFISHSNEDNGSFVRELVEKLTLLKVKVWYDEFSLEIGDSLIQSIDYGLSKSKFGIVVISESFLNKKWTDYEYRSLITREEKGEKTILPIWHNVTKEKVQDYSLYLADKFALNTSADSVGKIALKICQIVRPEIIQDIKGYLMFKELVKNGKEKVGRRSELKIQTKPQSKLSKSLLIRAKNIHLGIGRFLNFSFGESVFNYELDLRPEREIQTWEIMNATFLEFIEKYQINDDKVKYWVCRHLIELSVGATPTKTIFEDEELQDLVGLMKANSFEY
jgi:hypothetical protein